MAQFLYTFDKIWLYKQLMYNVDVLYIWNIKHGTTMIENRQTSRIPVDFVNNISWIIAFMWQPNGFWIVDSLKWLNYKVLPSLKLTAKARENGWLEDDPFLWGRSIFRDFGCWFYIVKKNPRVLWLTSPKTNMTGWKIHQFKMFLSYSKWGCSHVMWTKTSWIGGIFQCHVGFRRGVEYVLFFKENFPRFLLAAVGTFVKNIEDMEAGDIHRRTPLSLACQKGHLQVGWIVWITVVTNTESGRIS